MNMTAGSGTTVAPPKEIGSQMVSTSLPAKTDMPRLINSDNATFQAAFNSRSFSFSHNLANHPLFEISRLTRTAETILERGDLSNFSVFDASAVSTDTKFSRMPMKERLADTVRNIDVSGSWLKLSSVEKNDPEYREIMASIVREMQDLVGVDLRREITWSALTIFLASPHVVTPYHIDHESNFLFQIQGAKDLTLFDPTDRTILSSEEIERFYLGHVDAATYRGELANRGTTFRLSPGIAVHHPPLAPHSVRNGDNVSVSVSIAFGLPSLEARARVYQANHCLRRLGLHPVDPGKSHFTDGLKSRAISLLSDPRPKTRERLLFSGVERASLPIKLGERVRQVFRGA